jgi:ABC-type lipoprotein export system ATPase subunit/bifunctional DNA-binding transcriptional regulator/antitoxin component of YhaV-PrlF toxin-antitoxin module
MTDSTLDAVTARDAPSPLKGRTTAFGADALIVCDSLVRIYQTDDVEVQALQGLDLLIDRGEVVAIVGASGSGKSTLLSVLSAHDSPTAGKARVGDWDLMEMRRRDRIMYRRSMVGFVRQQTSRNLVPYLTAAENIDLPLAIAGKRSGARAQRIAEILDLLGIAYCSDRRPQQLSGGEQQRVAIGVALANSPEVLFADEPTGELDEATSHEVLEALRHVNSTLGVTVVIVTHDPGVSEHVGRTVAIRDGRTSSEVRRHTTTGSDGITQTTAQEFALLDRAGRVQLPAEYREALDLRDRVRLQLEDDHVTLSRDDVNERGSNTEHDDDNERGSDSERNKP